MAKFKGAGVAVLRRMLAQDPKMEAVFVASLSAEAREAFEKMVATSWIPVDLAAEIFEKAVPHLGDLRHLGQAVARENLNGIYKVFLRITTVDFVLSQHGKFWDIYFDQGVATIERRPDRPHSATMTVTEFAELPRALRELVCGFILEVFERTKSKNIVVAHHDQNPNLWQWHVSWN